MCSRVSIAGLALALTLAGWVGGAEELVAQPAPTISVDEVTRGQKGYGLSVFAGAEPQRFEVEVLGVMRNFSPKTSYILAELSGHGLEESGVVAGMSGSPVYFDDKLAGAVAFSWAFAESAIAGITPIESMRAMSALPAATAPARSADAPELANVVRGDVDLERLTAPLVRLGAAPMGRSGLQWMGVGLGETAGGLLEAALPGFAAVGAGTAEAAGELLPGSSVAGVLVDGDFRLAVTGTVTDRHADEVLAFGHAFLGQGPIRLPMAYSEVITVLPSSFMSFKIANLGEVVGAFDMDRVTGVRGRLGLEAPTVPFTIRIRGSQTEDYRLRLADVPVLTPSLVAISTLSSLDAAVRASGEQGLDLSVSFDLAGSGRLEIEQSFDGGGAGTDSALYLLALTSYLLNNPLDDVELDGIEVELTEHGEPRTARITGAHARRTRVAPGDEVQVMVELAPFRGEPYRETVTVQVPEDAAEGRYTVLLGDGVTMDATRLAVERAQPVNFRQALALLRSLHSRRELVSLGVVADAGLAVSGENLPRLPGSMRSLWQASPTRDVAALELAVAATGVRMMDAPLSGAVRIDLRVDRGASR